MKKKIHCKISLYKKSQWLLIFLSFNSYIFKASALINIFYLYLNLNESKYNQAYVNFFIKFIKKGYFI